MRRSLSLAVIAAVGTPACDISARIVSPCTIPGSVIMISAPLSRSSAKLPEMPCSAGGAPVTIERLLRMVLSMAVRRFSRTNAEEKRGYSGVRNDRLGFGHFDTGAGLAELLDDQP